MNYRAFVRIIKLMIEMNELPDRITLNQECQEYSKDLSNQSPHPESSKKILTLQILLFVAKKVNLQFEN